MVRLNNLAVEDSLNCVNALIKGNIPLCVVNFKEKNSIKLLNNIAFNADMFIAAENISTIEDAYNCVANGAQFFILEEFNYNLMNELKENGFFFIPKISTETEAEQCIDLGIEGVISPGDIKSDKLFNVADENCSESQEHCNPAFKIVNLTTCSTDYEGWINSVVKEMIGLNYVEVILGESADESEILFGNVFASTQKCKISPGAKNLLILECKNIDLALNYFKWRSIYIDPDLATVINKKIIEGPLDSKLGGFTIILREKRNEYC